MPEAGPYGITQFDAAGAINAYQTGQENRIRSLILQKQMEKMDHDAANQTSIQKAVAAYMGGDKSSEASPQPQPSVSAAPGAATAYADPLAPLPDASTASSAPAASTAAPVQAPQHSAADREKLFSTLVAIDPTVAGNYMDAFSKMDKAQVDQFAAKNTKIMQLMGGLMQLPPDQRKAAIQQSAPELQQLGYTPEQIAGFDPSDANLRSEFVKHQDADKIAEFVKPEFHSITQGGSLVETGPAGSSKTVYESPTVDVGGDVYARPDGMSSMPKPMTATNPKTGQKIQFNPQTKQWEPIGGQTGSGSSGGFQQ